MAGPMAVIRYRMLHYLAAIRKSKTDVAILGDNKPDGGISEPYIEFHHPWGRKSWIVKFNGPYENYRDGSYVPMHVELIDYEDANDPQSLHKTVKAGVKFQLVDLKKVGRCVRWTVKDCFKKNGTPCHFTVHYGPKGLEHFQIPSAASERQHYINSSNDPNLLVIPSEAPTHSYGCEYCNWWNP